MVRRFLLAGALILLVAGAVSGGQSAEAADQIWSTILQDPLEPSKGLTLAFFRFRGNPGVQVAQLSGNVSEDNRRGFSIGVGFDEMVVAVRDLLSDVTVPPPITERLFLLNTPCDKRFELTLRFTW